MATVGFIGSGRIGGTVARLAVAAGYQVIMSNSRGPQTLTGLVGELGPLAQAGSGEHAAAGGDLVVLTIPFRACQSVPAAPVYGAPYGPFSDPVGTPASEAAVRAALVKACR
jgi:predicted dinucleotide-binding enzyme